MPAPATLSRWILLLAFLVHGSTRPLSAQEKKLDRLLVSNSTISESRMPLYMAKDLGLFEKYGLDVEIVHIRGAAINIAALIAGEIQVAVAAGSVAVAAAARGAPIVIIATAGPTKYDLVSASIAAPQQLKNKIVGTGGYTSGDYFVLRRLLPRLGLAPDKDVSLIPIGSTSSYERLNMMLAGKVDAVAAIKANVERVRAQGVKLHVLASAEDYGIDGSGGDFFVTRELLRSRPGRIKAVLKAFGDAIRMGRENEELFHRAARGVLKETDPKLLQSFYRNNYFLGARPHDARPLESALDSDIKDLSATAPELKGRKAAEFIDATLLAEVEKEGFFAWTRR